MAKKAVILAEMRSRIASGEAKRLRLAHRLTLGEVADDVGVTASAVHAWEAGAYLPNGPHALAYADLLRELSWVDHEPA